jgi:hypothetical protein
VSSIGDRSVRATFPEALVEPMVKAGCPEGGIILDPFFGAGTTGVVAAKHKRKWIGIELNPEYAAMARKRIADDNQPRGNKRPSQRSGSRRGQAREEIVPSLAAFLWTNSWCWDNEGVKDAEAHWNAIQQWMDYHVRKAGEKAAA